MARPVADNALAQITHSKSQLKESTTRLVGVSPALGMVSQPQKRASSFCEMLCRQRCSPPMYSMIWHTLCKCQVECQFKLNEKTVYLCVFVAPVERVILAWWMPGSKGLQYNYCNPPALEFKRATLPSDYCKPKFEPLLVMTTHEQSLAVDCCYPTSKKNADL